MKGIDQLDLSGKRVFIRVDFNVPIKDGKVTDTTRIDASLATIRYAVEKKARVVLASHLGRPKGAPEAKYSLKQVLPTLCERLGSNVSFCEDCIGSAAEAAVAALQPGAVLLLENLRFHAGEEKNDPAMCAALAKLADTYINDAFGTAHRAHASTAGMAALVKERAAGFLLKKECDYLARIRSNPEHPFVAILGGAKVSDKIGVIRRLLDSVDALLIGGAMAYTFLKAGGHETGKSLVELDKVDLARELLALAGQKGVRLLLPVDHVVAAEAKPGVACEIVAEVPSDRAGFDIGPATVSLFRQEIAAARTIFWNGPVGLFEIAPFDAGTMAMAAAVADSHAVSIVGGGDSVAAVSKSGRSQDITHISTGGGASLEFIEGMELPGIVALTDDSGS